MGRRAVRLTRGFGATQSRAPGDSDAHPPGEAFGAWGGGSASG